MKVLVRGNRKDLTKAGGLATKSFHTRMTIMVLVLDALEPSETLCLPLLDEEMEGILWCLSTQKLGHFELQYVCISFLFMSTERL